VFSNQLTDRPSHHSFPYASGGDEGERAFVADQDLYRLMWKDADGQYPIGYVLARVVQELEQVPPEVVGEIVVDHVHRTLSLFQLPTEAERSRCVAALASYWRERSTFKLLNGWRNEVWPVYSRKGELLFSVERAAMGLFGTMRYGVHMKPTRRRAFQTSLSAMEPAVSAQSRTSMSLRRSMLARMGSSTRSVNGSMISSYLPIWSLSPKTAKSTNSTCAMWNRSRGILPMTNTSTTALLSHSTFSFAIAY